MLGVIIEDGTGEGVVLFPDDLTKAIDALRVANNLINNSTKVRYTFDKPSKCLDCPMYDGDVDKCVTNWKRVVKPLEIPDWCELEGV